MVDFALSAPDAGEPNLTKTTESSRAKFTLAIVFWTAKTIVLGIIAPWVLVGTLGLLVPLATPDSRGTFQDLFTAFATANTDQWREAIAAWHNICVLCFLIVCFIRIARSPFVDSSESVLVRFRQLCISDEKFGKVSEHIGRVVVGLGMIGGVALAVMAWVNPKPFEAHKQQIASGPPFDESKSERAGTALKLAESKPELHAAAVLELSGGSILRGLAVISKSDSAGYLVRFEPQTKGQDKAEKK